MNRSIKSNTGCALAVTLLFIVTNIFYQVDASSYTSLPNIDYMLLGYDAFVGQPTLSALKYPVFQPFDYSDSQNVTIESTVFMVPNGITCIDYPSETEKSVTQIYTSELLLQQSVYESYSQGFNPWYSMGMFSSSQQSEYFHQVYKEQASYTATTNLEYTVFKVWYNEKEELDIHFKNALANLPDDYNNATCKLFSDFFKAYGTHFIFQAIYGASVLGQTTFSVTLLQSLTFEEIHEDIQTQFILSTQAILTYYQEQQLESLNAMYSSIFVLQGGDPASYNVTEYQEWESTILSDPILTKMELRNFTELINQNETSRIQALNNAMTDYFYSWYTGWQELGSAPYNLFYSWPSYTRVGMDVYFFSSSVYKYNLIENLWYNIPIGPYSNTVLYSCAAISTNIYCFGGTCTEGTNCQAESVAYVLDTQTMSWNPIPNMPYGMWSARVVANGDTIYIFGGVSGFGMNHCSSWYIQSPNLAYDISSQTYTVLENVPSCVVGFQAGAIVFENMIYLSAPVNCDQSCYQSGDTCYCGAEPTNTFWKYDITANAWSQLANMPNTLENFGTFEADGVIYIVGGVDASFAPSASIYAYSIGDNSWSTITTTSHSTASMGVVTMLEKLLFYFGGNYYQKYYQSETVQMTALTKFC